MRSMRLKEDLGLQVGDENRARVIVMEVDGLDDHVTGWI